MKIGLRGLLLVLATILFVVAALTRASPISSLRVSRFWRPLSSSRRPVSVATWARDDSGSVKTAGLETPVTAGVF
jgi:hypothetical protein